MSSTVICEEDGKWFSPFITHHESHQGGSGYHLPRGIILSVGSDMTNQSPLSCLTSPVCLFFGVIENKNETKKWDYDLTPSSNSSPPVDPHPPLGRTFPLLLLLLSSLFHPRLSFFTLHTWVSWHKVLRLHVPPPPLFLLLHHLHPPLSTNPHHLFLESQK